MKVSNLRSKQRTMQRALQSIALPPHNQKAVTEGYEAAEQAKVPPEFDQKIVNNSRRYTKPKPIISFAKNVQQSKMRQSKKYRSLQIARRDKRISQQKLRPYLNSKDQKVARPSRHKFSMQIMKPIEPTNNRYSAVAVEKAQDKGLPELKQKAKVLIEKGKYQLALEVLRGADQLHKAELNYLELKGFCLLKLHRYEKALECLNRVIALDRKSCRQTYIWCALCEMQLGRKEKSHQYLEECIKFFPLHYEAHYLKGKLLTKQRQYHFALQSLRIAESLNASKKEIRFHIADCLELSGDIPASLTLYQQLIKEISPSTISFVLNFTKLLVKLNKFEEAERSMEQIIKIGEKSHFFFKFQESINENHYILAVNYLKKGQYQKCIMKGEQILKKSSPKWAVQTIKLLMSAKIAMRDFYGASNLAQRLDLMGCQTNLKQLGVFCEGVILLMRKKAVEAAQKLQICQKLLGNSPQNFLNCPIKKVINLYLFYAYFLTLRQSQALTQLQQQKRKGIGKIHQNSTAYNEKITQGYIAYNNKQFDKAAMFFSQAVNGNTYKPDALLYLSITLFQKLGDPQAQIKLKQSLNRCCKEMQQFNNNIAANAFYHRGLLRAIKKDYNSALEDLDTAIDKSQDNFVKFFYTRGLIWSLVQNYKQAVSDLSIALSIDPLDTRCYELRVRCLQINGDPSQAFADLQNFISLKPNDKEIHKLAGHLLFENGAFQDAIEAFSQGELHNHDCQVFVTRGKTQFLLGNFIEASADMLKASQALQRSDELFFDFKVMKWLGGLFLPYHSQKNDCFQSERLQQCLEELAQIYDQESKGKKIFGKIFKSSQFYCLSGLCKFYLKQYHQAAESFMEVINAKLLSFSKQVQGDYEEQQAEKQIFVNQMYYNVALCFCMLKDYKNAEKFIVNCKIDPQVHTYEAYQLLLGHIRGAVQIEADEQYRELFSFKNKISRFLPEISVPFQSTKGPANRKMKICIPYPKVEPPNISPVFDKSLVQEVSLNYIERRPEAPWIFKQNNAIKFTERMEVYSRFSLGESSVGDTKKQENKGEQFEEYMNFSTQLMDRLKLDAKVEEKLNKLLKNK